MSKVVSLNHTDILIFPHEIIVKIILMPMVYLHLLVQYDMRPPRSPSGQHCNPKRR